MRQHQRRQALGGLHQQRKVAVVHWTDKGRIVRAFAPQIQVGAFKMQTQKSRRTYRGNPRFKHGLGRLRRICNKRR